MNMRIQRRHLPSMNALAAFEAAERTGGFTTAARELNLTQGAVSRQIQTLEAQLGAALFRREGRTVTPTEAGRAYAARIRTALGMIGAASVQIMTDPHGGAIRLAALPTLGARWLAPRLPRFYAAHPGISVDISSRLAPVDFRTEPLDAAIHSGGPQWGDVSCVSLMTEIVAPVCAPDFAARCGLNAPEDLLSVPLLHIGTRPDAWADWFSGKGFEYENGEGLHFEQFTVAAQAAAAGLGVALLPLFLIEPELEQDALIAPLPDGGATGRRYDLIMPKNRLADPAMRAFSVWLVSEATDKAI